MKARKERLTLQQQKSHMRNRSTYQNTDQRNHVTDSEEESRSIDSEEQGGEYFKRTSLITT